MTRTPPRRRLSQFGLRTMFVGMTLCGIITWGLATRPYIKYRIAECDWDVDGLPMAVVEPELNSALAYPVVALAVYVGSSAIVLLRRRATRLSLASSGTSIRQCTGERSHLDVT